MEGGVTPQASDGLTPDQAGHGWAVTAGVHAPFCLATGLAAFYVLAAVVGPPVARHAGELAPETGPAAWALALSSAVVRHRAPVLAALAVVSLGCAAAAIARPRCRRPVAASAALVLTFDVLFLAVLLWTFYATPSRFGEQPW